MPADSSLSRPRSRNAGNTSARGHPAPDRGNADTPRSAPPHTTRAPPPSAPAGSPPAYPTAGTHTPGRNGAYSPHTPARSPGSAPHPPAAAAPAPDDTPDTDPNASASHARSTDTLKDAATTSPGSPPPAHAKALKATYKRSPFPGSPPSSGHHSVRT